ncbi:YpdA family putative bacillithiol disulfide reductase [Arachidicoccus soli]|uniref:YpdA family putative bacillithiol disulfide reductase n=1 Tax=Arachidicoccus soli TaxID=2341117 RepID=A0A386HM55_9BACT|nr:YpdA family putative bacillithiol disulfide reductase [Arachidicoccus soli]AYD46610.1 YpdA family putative bacillithiol disulfide reductase [Arachidicoccus soli]
MKDLDILIIGAGPIGLACAIEAQKAGLNYLIVEKGALVNSLFNYPLFMTFFSTADRLEIGNIPFMCLAPKPGRQEALEYYRSVANNKKLNINLYEKVEKVKKQLDEGFIVLTSKAEYKAKNVIVATGFYDIPIYMDIPGETLPKVRHYYKEPHEYVMQKILVVGANNSAVDAALEIWRKGGDVTMVIRGDKIGDRVKYWVKPDIENRIKEGSIKAYFNSELLEITDKEVKIKTAGKETIVLENDFVLALTGFRPNFEMLQNFGVEINQQEQCFPAHNLETMETNIPGLFLAGVVCGGLNTHKWFIENSRVHAVKIVEYILRKN